LANLLGYDFDIVYKLGEVADVLSRKYEEQELQVLSNHFGKM